LIHRCGSTENYTPTLREHWQAWLPGRPASAIIPPALAALSLGIVGRKLFPARISRNESFNHGCNFAAAILAGTVGQPFGYQWIFYLVCLFALGSAAAVALIRPQEVNYTVARGADDQDPPTEVAKTKNAKAIPIPDFFKRRELMIFLGSVVLFYFGNAAMLPRLDRRWWKRILARTSSLWVLVLLPLS
jgi:hypothetical protein